MVSGPMSYWVDTAVTALRMQLEAGRVSLKR